MYSISLVVWILLAFQPAFHLVGYFHLPRTLLRRRSRCLVFHLVCPAACQTDSRPPYCWRTFFWLVCWSDHFFSFWSWCNPISFCISLTRCLLIVPLCVCSLGTLHFRWAVISIHIVRLWFEVTFSRAVEVGLHVWFGEAEPCVFKRFFSGIYLSSSLYLTVLCSDRWVSRCYLPPLLWPHGHYALARWIWVPPPPCCIRIFSFLSLDEPAWVFFVEDIHALDNRTR